MCVVGFLSEIAIATNAYPEIRPVVEVLSALTNLIKSRLVVTHVAY